MKFFYLFIFIFFLSCGYPDIDSVPNFEDLKITKEESIDLCKLSNSGNEEINECLNKLSIQDK